MKIIMLLGFGALLFTGFSFFCAAQDKPENTEPASVYAELEKAPPKYRAKANPLIKDKEAVPAGKVLFEEHCEECHGENALGTKKAPSLRAQEVQSAPAGAVFWILTNGVVRKGMPVWSKLPEPERWQLVTYVQSLGPNAATAENKLPPKP
jgi:cytochrome c oxidase cbb3-type subunit 2